MGKGMVDERIALGDVHICEENGQILLQGVVSDLRLLADLVGIWIEQTMGFSGC
jgi:hypothetical protein